MDKEIESIIAYDHENGGVYACNFEGEPLNNWHERGMCAFSYGFVVMRMKRVLGQVLTVVDASFSNEAQKKAVKDIIKNDFALLFSDLWEVSEPKFQEIIDKSSEEAIKSGKLGEASLDEALGLE